MSSAKAKLYYTKEKYLSSLPVKDGNIIFIPESHKVCLDMSKTRYTYQTIGEFATDAERLSATPQKGFYFVAETHAIWRYQNDQWNRITAENLNPTVYGDIVDDFPDEGNPQSLYFTDEGIYNWKQALGEYNLIANANRWDSID